LVLIGFDTSLPTTSACVLRDDGEAFCTEAPDPDRLLGSARHSQELLSELERLLGESGTSWDELESIAVGVGPGTFTGLRIGVSTARALAQALRLRIRPVSSLEALAAGAAVEMDVGPGRQVLAMIDARRGQVFAALYSLVQYASPGVGPPRSPARLEPVWEQAVLDPEALLKRVRELGRAPLCAGDWAIRSRSELEEAGAEVPLSDSGIHAVNALYLCGLATEVKPVPHRDVYPIYLRLPDAEVRRRA
jgi:tRNA threonylcarbamoyladenosine biosynthesis protein TsaB